MKYEINILPEALKEIAELDVVYREILDDAYQKVKTVGIHKVNINSLGNKIHEIKAGKTRSIFKYAKGQIIVIGVVFLKKSQKTPNHILKLADKRLKP